MRQLSVLLQKEFIQIKRHAFLPKLIIAFPIMMMLVMPWVTTMDVKNVGVSIINNDGQSLSRQIVSDIKASEYFIVNEEPTTYAEALELLEDSKIDVIVSIPADFEKNLVLQIPSPIDVAANAVNGTKGSLGSQYMVQTIASSLQDYQAEKGLAAATEIASVLNWYNPTLNYKFLMIPALMIMLLVLICGFLPAINIVSEKESGSIEQINVTPVGKLTFTLAKLIPFWIIGIFVLSVAMLIAYLVYGLKPMGSLLSIYVGAVLFVLAFSGLGVTIANKSDNIQQTMFVMFFFIMNFILLSGLFTPISSMPRWAQYITYILPPRYFIEIMRSVYLKGTTLIELWPNLAALGVFVLIFNSLAWLTYKKQQ